MLHSILEKNYNKIPDVEYGITLLLGMLIEQQFQNFSGYEKYSAELKESIKINPSLKLLEVFAQASEVNVKIFQGDFKEFSHYVQKQCCKLLSTAIIVPKC